MAYKQAEAVPGPSSLDILEKSGKVLAIITARGGSKGLPRKNVMPLDGKPLVAYSIDAALSCPYIERCIVTTEDPEIKAISIRFGAEVMDRPRELATDDALSKDVVSHVLENLQYREELPEFFILLQPTSPLRNAVHVQTCIEHFLQSGLQSAISVTESEHHPYKAFLLQEQTLLPLVDEKYLDKPRQILPRIYRQNGAIYLLRSKDFLEKGTFYIPPVMPFVMDARSSVDIDTAFDLQIAEHSIALARRNTYEESH